MIPLVALILVLLAVLLIGRTITAITGAREHRAEVAAREKHIAYLEAWHDQYPSGEALAEEQPGTKSLLAQLKQDMTEITLYPDIEPEEK